MENELCRKKVIFSFLFTLLTLLLLTSFCDSIVVGDDSHSDGGVTRQKSEGFVEDSGTDVKEQTETVPASSELPGVGDNLNKVHSKEMRVDIPSSGQHDGKETSVNKPENQEQANIAKGATGHENEQQDIIDGSDDSPFSSHVQHVEAFDGGRGGQHKQRMSHLIEDEGISNHNKQLSEEPPQSGETAGEMSDQDNIAEGAHLFQQTTQEEDKVPSNEQSVEGPDMSPGSKQLYEGFPGNEQSVKGLDVIPENGQSVEGPDMTADSEPSVEGLSMTTISKQSDKSPNIIPGSNEPVESADAPPESHHFAKVSDTTLAAERSDDVPGVGGEQSLADAPSNTPSSELLAEGPDSSNEQSMMAPKETPVSEQSIESPDDGIQQSVSGSDMTSSSEKSMEVPNSESSLSSGETESKSGKPVTSQRPEKDAASVIDNPEKREVGEEEPQTKQNAEEPGDDLYVQGEELIAKLSFQAKAKGYELLKKAVDMGNTKALEKIAYGYLFGNALRRNFTRAFEIFTSLANKGVPAGQLGLGFMYSTGIGVDSDQAKTVLYYTFAALGGHPLAQMAIGYRASVGVTTTQSCESALSYYHKAASQVVEEVSLFTGGQAVQKARLSEDEEGDGPNVFGGITEDEVERYRDVFADTGAQLSLGMYYMFGLGGTERNLQQAVHYLERAVASDPGTAYALLGRIYAEGSPPEIPQSNEKALVYFKKAIEEGSAEGHSGLGMLYFKGMGVEKDYSKAMVQFAKAAERGSPEAYFYIGLGFLYGLGKVKNTAKAVNNLKIAAQAGHVLAIFHLGEMNAKGGSGQRNCQNAVELLKSVSERGKWSKMLREAYKTYLLGDIDSALMMYLYLGELGYEVAQTNAAFILEEDETEMMDQNETLKRALVLWSRSATQGYSVARVKLGDYYYYGLGTETNLEEAVDQYRMAADHMANSQAMFNLGYMYELGIGLQQDIHLAKRYYDMAVAHNPAAALPANLALIKVHAKLWHEYAHEYFSQSRLYKVMFAEGEAYFGDSWDIYLIAILCVLLAVVIRWHMR